MKRGELGMVREEASRFGGLIALNPGLLMRPFSRDRLQKALIGRPPNLGKLSTS